MDYEKFMSEYNKSHKCCPKCGSSKVLVTFIGFIVNMAKMNDYKDRNSAECACGWKGIVDELVPLK